MTEHIKGNFSQKAVSNAGEGFQITNYDEMERRIAENQFLAATKRAEIVARPGGLEEFKSDLIFDPVVSDEEHQLIEDFKAGKVFEDDYNKVMANIDRKVGEFYEPYVKSFPIKEEQEARGGPNEEAGEGFFGIVTDRNFDSDFKKVHGEFREFMYIVRDPQTKQAIGGMNFTVYPAKDGQPLEGKYAATLHSTYVFFDPDHRSLGLARKVMDARDQIAADYVAKVAPDVAAKSSAILTVSEQNIPEQMDPISFMTDSGMAVRQEKRLEVWYSLGYNRFDFDGAAYDKYVQPALEEGGETCDVLSLNGYATKVDFSKPGVADAQERYRIEDVEASTLKHHLGGFFGTSVVGSAVAGDPNHPDHDPTTVEAMNNLGSMGKQKIKTFGYTESMDRLVQQRAEISHFLSTASHDEIHSGEQIQDLMKQRGQGLGYDHDHRIA